MTSNPNTEDPLNALKTYRTGNLKKVLHGNVYQLKLLMLHAYCGWKNGYTFRLATEMTDAGKFDDVVIWYKDKNKDLVHLQCLQVKHSWDLGKKIQQKDLLYLEDGPYRLDKYFDSFRKIKEELVKKNGSSELNACIIWTNIPLDVEKDREGNDIISGESGNEKILVKKVDDVDEFLQITNSGNSTRKNDQLLRTGKRYQLLSGPDENPGVYKRLRKLLDAHVLARELAKELASCIYEKKKICNTGMIRIYHPALATYVIDSKNNNQEQEDNKPAFHGDFETCVEGTDKGEFKKYFLEKCRELITKGGGSGTRPTDAAVWSEIKDKLKESEIFPTFGTPAPIPQEGIKNSSEESSENTILGAHIDSLPGNDKDIEEFLKKFFFAVGQLDEKELGKSIKKQIRDEEKLNCRAAAFVNGLFQKKMLNWLKVTGKKPEIKVRYLTDEHVKRFFIKVLNESEGDEGQDQIHTRLCIDSDDIPDSEDDEELSTVPAEE